MSGLIAIVGRPNVGKSALFNRIARKRIAIVHDQPGVTRDRVSAEIEWRGRPFTLVDTGGIGVLAREKTEDDITRSAYEQVQLAIETADVVFFVVNVQEGVMALDREVALRLRESGKPVIVLANKVDNSKLDLQTGEFSELGFGEVLSVSALHGRGIDELMDQGMTFLPPAPPVEERRPFVVETELAEGETPGAATSRPSGPFKLAIVGRPNVGKSSIVNALTHSKRVIVSPIAGTTRDSVDVPFEVVTDGVKQQYVLIDTAGMRKRRRVDDSVEFFSVKRAEESIERCDLVVLVLDAESGITEQDKKIADIIIEARRSCVVVVNKWDLMKESVNKAREEEIERHHGSKTHRKGSNEALTTLDEFSKWVQEKLFFLDYAPVIFTSATTGFQLDRLLEAVRYVAAQLQQKIATSLLNRVLHKAIEVRQPVSDMGHHLRFYYATQVRQAPPTFLLFVNRNELFSPQYVKYLGGEMRRAFGYEGCPIVLVAKARPKTVESKRKPIVAKRGPRLGNLRETRRAYNSNKPSNKARISKGLIGRKRTRQ